MPIYGADRLGVYVRGTAGGSDYINYQITDHLGNVRGVIKRIPGNPIAAMITFSDYYPFGEKLPTRDNITGNYRYAYQGQELDGETRMEAFQLRLWDGRIGRWLNPDPKGQYASPYLGMGNNPANRIDPDGGTDGGPEDPPLFTTAAAQQPVREYGPQPENVAASYAIPEVVFTATVAKPERILLFGLIKNPNLNKYGQTPLEAHREWQNNPFYNKGENKWDNCLELRLLAVMKLEENLLVVVIICLEDMGE